MKPIYRYISRRFEQKVDFSNLIRIMHQRHEIYEKIYKFELDCHGNEEEEAITPRKQIQQILDVKQMKIRQWSSNSTRLLETILK